VKTPQNASTQTIKKTYNKILKYIYIMTDRRKTRVDCSCKKEPSRGYHFGSMRECLEADKIGRYGKYRIDKILLEEKENEKNIDKLYIELAGIRGTLSRINRKFQSSKITKEEQRELKKQYEKNMEELRRVGHQINSLKK
jgi:hypothetical protein